MLITIVRFQERFGCGTVVDDAADSLFPPQKRPLCFRYAKFTGAIQLSKVLPFPLSVKLH